MLTHLMLWQHLTVCLVLKNSHNCYMSHSCLSSCKFFFFLLFLLDAYTYSICLQEKLDMELQVRLWPASYHQCLFAEITSTKSHFCEICLRFKHFLSLYYARITYVYMCVENAFMLCPIMFNFSTTKTALRWSEVISLLDTGNRTYFVLSHFNHATMAQ